MSNKEDTEREEGGPQLKSELAAASLEEKPVIKAPIIVRVEYFSPSSCQSSIRSFLHEDLKLNPLKTEFQTHRSKEEPGQDCLLYYSDIECAYKALCIVQDVQFSGETLKAFMELNTEAIVPDGDVDADVDAENENENDESDGLGAEDQAAQESTEAKEEEDINDRTIPNQHVPYIKQICEKQRHMHKILRKICKRISDVGDKTVTSWLKLGKGGYKDLPCDLLPIRTSGVIKEYRNKCEFTIGKSLNGQDTLIGFTVCKLTETKTLDYVPVGLVDHLPHIPQKMKDLVKILQDYVKSSGLEPYNPWSRSACWSSVTMRINQNGNVMIIMTIEACDLPQSRLQTIKQSLIDWFDHAGRKAGVTSLYSRAVYPKVKGLGSKDEICHLCGDLLLEAKMCNLSFQISADAFFQVNTKAAEILYRTALELARVDKDTTVLDVCCGTGTIGIFFSQYCGEVLGVESVESAVLNARENAKRNDVVNCEFFHGKAEELLGPLIRRATRPKIVAIVDPPRAGLHKRAIWSLRREERISRVIYISCAPKAAMPNIINLGRTPSKAYKGEPFVPVAAVPVDMFPHTNHCELVVCLERASLASNARKLKLEEALCTEDDEKSKQKKREKTVQDSEREGDEDPEVSLPKRTKTEG